MSAFYPKLIYFPCIFTSQWSIKFYDDFSACQPVLGTVCSWKKTGFWSKGCEWNLHQRDQGVKVSVFIWHTSVSILPICIYTNISSFAVRRIMMLEFSQYVENFLWPNFGPSTVNLAHILSIVVMINEKFRERVPAWEVFLPLKMIIFHKCLISDFSEFQIKAGAISMFLSVCAWSLPVWKGQFEGANCVASFPESLLQQYGRGFDSWPGQKTCFTLNVGLSSTGTF